MTLPEEYFDGLYAGSADPWGFASRWYEQRKRALTLAALPRARYGIAFEPGCSIGVLTHELAQRCDNLLATDVSQAALDAAARRLAGLTNVRLERRALADWPDGRFDLVVLSELLYYLGPADLPRTAARAVESVAEGGTLLAVHWRHLVADYPTTGDDAQAALAGAASAEGLVRTVEHLEDDVALTVHVRPRDGQDPGRSSVAAEEGLC